MAVSDHLFIYIDNREESKPIYCARMCESFFPSKRVLLRCVRVCHILNVGQVGYCLEKCKYLSFTFHLYL